MKNYFLVCLLFFTTKVIAIGVVENSNCKHNIKSIENCAISTLKTAPLAEKSSLLCKKDGCKSNLLSCRKHNTIFYKYLRKQFPDTFNQDFDTVKVTERLLPISNTLF